MSQGETDRAGPERPASDEIYRALVDAMEEGVVVRDLDGRVIAHNESALRVLALSASQLMGTTSIDPRWRAVHEDGTPFDAENHPSNVSLRTGAPQSRVVMGLHRPDGEVRWLSVTSRYIAAGPGQLQAVLVTFLDVTESRRAETERRRAEEERDRFFALSLDMLCTADMSGRFRTVNPAFSAVLGWTPEELLSRPFFELVHPDDQAATVAILAGLGEGKNSVQFENRYRCKDGSWKWMSWNTPALRPGEDTLYAVARDVTERKRADKALAEAIDAANRGRHQFEQMASLSPSTIYILDFKRRVPIYTNRNAAHSLGYTPEQVMAFGERFSKHIAHPDDVGIVARHFDDLAGAADGAVVEFISRVRHASGQWRWVVRRETVLSRYPDASACEILGNASDITDLKEAEQRLEALARTDSLTGLPNVRMVRERLGLMMAECGRGRRLALMMVDIDHFKRLNDTYGHGAGDSALCEVARILRANVRATDLVGRYGGEEFCVLLADVDQPSALVVAEKLRSALHEIQNPCAVTASFGVTSLSTADGSAAETMARADQALYRAKQNGRDRIEAAAAPPSRPPAGEDHSRI